MSTTPARVLEFWFGPAPFSARAEWFRKSETFDAAIREQFEPAVQAALDGRLPQEWHHGAEQRLAHILLLDQFTRNIYRDTARAVAGDACAQQLAAAMVDEGADRALDPVQRWFVYLPFEHAEDAGLQQRSVQMFRALAKEAPTLSGALDYAERHRAVIQRFGRFPHRNAWLGRPSTAEELAFLAQPGSSF